ncbi:MAG TPA: hypothetical protein PLH97_00130 [Verrucomicrobiota bacterium]|nr:hypothetical protein [Verrucomicrobiota bacterium]
MASLLTACSTTTGPARFTGGLKGFQERASRFDSIVSLPTFETTTDEIFATVTNTIVAGDAALDRIGQLQPRQVNFRNTIGALDDLGFQVLLVANRLSLMEQTSTNAAIREAATAAIKTLEEWMVGLDYREDVYRAVKAYADRSRACAGRMPSCCSRRCATIAAPGWICRKPSGTRWSGCGKNWLRCPRISRTTSRKRPKR